MLKSLTFHPCAFKAQIFRFPVGYEKVEIKVSKSKMEHYRRLNKVRYRQQLSISNAL